MKKALIIIFTLLIVIFVANIIFYIITDDTVVGVVEDNIVNREKTLDEFFNIKSKNLATHTYSENVSSIDGYKIKLLESAIDTKNHKGYFKFELTLKDTDMRNVISNDSSTSHESKIAAEFVINW